jgi:hypothetical protein
MVTASLAQPGKKKTQEVIEEIIQKIHAARIIAPVKLRKCIIIKIYPE